MSLNNLKKLVIASHNQGKIKEIKELLSPFGIDIVAAAKLGLAEPEETGTTFIANSQLKAVEIAKKSQLPALADDSGLVVPALNGQPGIHSARWAEVTPGGSRDFDVAIAKVATLLNNQPDTPASMVCVLTLAYPTGNCHSFTGTKQGTLQFPKRGVHGFGYDAIFQPMGYQKTYAEMESYYKHQISARAEAFSQLLQFLKAD